MLELLLIISLNLIQYGDSHLIVTPQGRVILIDAGTEAEAQQAILPYLRSRRITQIDIGIISHAHTDHYQGFGALADSGITIGKLYYNFPDVRVCGYERAWTGGPDCDVVKYAAFLQDLDKRRVELVNPLSGDTLYSEGDLSLVAIYNNRDHRLSADVNDEALIIKLIYGDFSMLFPGDLNTNLGSELAKSSIYKATILKVPHHGTESLAPNTFFDTVKPKDVVVPSPLNLWQSDRSKRVREYFKNAYVTGYSNVIIKSDGVKYTITYENTTVWLPVIKK